MKSLFLSLSFCCLSVIAMCQGVKIGPKAGINFANQTGDLEEPGGTVGLRGGAFVNIGIAEKFSIEPQLLYSSYGSEALSEESFSVPNVGNADMAMEVDNHSDYLSLPILAQVKLHAGEEVSFYANAGPRLSYLVNGKSNYSFDLNANISTQDTTIRFDTTLNKSYSDRFEKLDLGLTLGAGVAFKMDNGALTVDLVYNLGLLNIVKSNYIVPSNEFDDLVNSLANPEGIFNQAVNGNIDDYNPAYEAEVRNSSFSIMLGYAFDL